MNIENENTTIAKVSIKEEFKDFIVKLKHPCVMANTVFMLDHYRLEAYSDLENVECLKTLLNDLEEYLGNYDFDSNDFESFLAVFPNSTFDSEIEFEYALWKSLQRLHELDDCAWDASVSNDPNNPHFSFSLKGRAFYIIGLHPESSRIARQSPYPTFVFNLHWQFERLREMGTYKKVKSTIRRRDKKLQGQINPVLKDFGDDSETKQYSGRAVEADWKCPFHTKS